MKTVNKKPKETIKAHGATKPVELLEDDVGPWLRFGSTVAVFEEQGGSSHPVSFLGLDNIKKLRNYLNEVIDYLEAHES